MALASWAGLPRLYWQQTPRRPNRSHVEQMYEEVIAQLTHTLGKHTVGGADDVGAQHPLFGDD